MSEMPASAELTSLVHDQIHPRTVVLVGGPPGSGKSALLRQITNDASESLTKVEAGQGIVLDLNGSHRRRDIRPLLRLWSDAEGADEAAPTDGSAFNGALVSAPQFGLVAVDGVDALAKLLPKTDDSPVVKAVGHLCLFAAMRSGGRIVLATMRREADAIRFNPIERQARSYAALFVDLQRLHDMDDGFAARVIISASHHRHEDFRARYIASRGAFELDES